LNKKLQGNLFDEIVNFTIQSPDVRYIKHGSYLFQSLNEGEIKLQRCTLANICHALVWSHRSQTLAKRFCDLSRGPALSFDQDENLTYDIHPNRVFSFVH
jgi:hypothetical protein